MKKLNLWLLASLLVATYTLTACGDDDSKSNDDSKAPESVEVPGGTELTAENIVGTWTINGTDDSHTYIFTKTDVTISYNSQVGYKGAYTLKDGLLTIQENTFKPVLLKKNNVLILKIVAKDNNDKEYEELGMILYRKGAAISVSSDEIQGDWRWYMFGDTEFTRTGMKFNGNKFELVIVPWVEKYVGTFTYANGIISLNVTDGFTSREEGTGYGSGEGDMDPNTLEGNWKTLDKDHWHVDAVDNGPFIVNGTEAYGIVANLMALFHKK